MVVSERIATETVNKWMDFKNIPARKRAEKETKASIKAIFYAICDGYLTMDDNHNFVQKLMSPVLDKDGKPVLAQLIFKPRLLLGEVEDALMNVKSDNGIGMLRAYASALCGQNSGLLRKLDTDDNKTSQAIVMFFL